MFFNVGDIVSRNSYNNDIFFKVLKIDNDTVYLKGMDVRLIADAPISDLRLVDNYKKDNNLDEKILNESTDRSSEFFYLPGKILHIDGDGEYLDRCLKFYKSNKVYAVGKKINESDMPNQIEELLKNYKPDILVITGHDAYYKKKGNINNIENYKNSKYFVRTINKARNIEKGHDKLVIIAGACQSDYESLIKAGANYASSPKRINIHALDPAIIAVELAITERSKEIDLIKMLNKTKYGADGIGGIISNGLMYVGFPR